MPYDGLPAPWGFPKRQTQETHTEIMPLCYRNISNRSAVSNRSALRDYVEKLKAQSPIEAQCLYWSLTRCGESRDSAYAHTIFAHKFACITESTFKVFSFEYFSSVFNFTNPVCTDISFRFVAFSHSLALLSLRCYNTGILPVHVHSN